MIAPRPNPRRKPTVFDWTLTGGESDLLRGPLRGAALLLPFIGPSIKDLARGRRHHILGDITPVFRPEGLFWRWPDSGEAGIMFPDFSHSQTIGAHGLWRPPLTVFMVVYPASTVSNQIMISNGGWDPGPLGWLFATQDSNLRQQHQSVQTFTATGAATGTPGQLTMYAVSLTANAAGGRCRMYKNGVQLTDDEMTAGPAEPYYRYVRVGTGATGGDPDVGSYSWRGDIGMAVGLDRALSAAEHRALADDPWGGFRPKRHFVDFAFALAPTTEWYFTDTTSGGWPILQMGGTAPTAATIGTGWDVTGVPAGRWALMEYGVVREPGDFSSGTRPTAGPDNTLKDGWRTATPLSGSAEAGNWLAQLPLVAVSGNGADVRVLFRVWRSSNADGSSPTEVTSGWQEGSVLTNLTGTQQVSAVTAALGALTLSNEYLFAQVALETA